MPLCGIYRLTPFLKFVREMLREKDGQEGDLYQKKGTVLDYYPLLIYSFAIFGMAKDLSYFNPFC